MSSAKTLSRAARFARLYRIKSSNRTRQWGDIDWESNRFTVRASKTEHHVGSGIRIVPLFPELRPLLEAAFDAAEPGAEFVITKYRATTQNLRAQMQRIIVRAGLKPWVKTFQNLRSTRATELCEQFPSHVAAEWLGHSVEIANANYRQVTDTHFHLAATNPSCSALRNPVQYPSEMLRDGSQTVSPTNEETPVLQGFAVRCEPSRTQPLAKAGFEPARRFRDTGF